LSKQGWKISLEGNAFSGYTMKAEPTLERVDLIKESISKLSLMIMEHDTKDILQGMGTDALFILHSQLRDEIQRRG
jgi:hypothetical protein